MDAVEGWWDDFFWGSLVVVELFVVALILTILFGLIGAAAKLSGIVPTPVERIEAVRLAWQADGITEMINELQVTDDSGVVDYAKDIWISAQLKTMLLFDKQIHATNYNVETVNGSVYMIGTARDVPELERATNHARTIKGVRNVISHVRLKNAPSVNSPASATQ